MTRARPLGRNLIVAFLAAAALLLQAVVGMSPASAAPGHTIEICTAHGSKTVTLDAAGQPTSPKQAPCPHCDLCLNAALAVDATAPLLTQPVRYAVQVELSPTVFVSATSVRGPPRPPSQAPPSLLNV